MAHVIKVGVDYIPKGKRTEVRHEPGDVVDDLPAEVAKSWLKQGIIEVASAKADSGKGAKS